jgi:hypothetical protein
MSRTKSTTIKDFFASFLIFTFVVCALSVGVNVVYHVGDCGQTNNNIFIKDHHLLCQPTQVDLIDIVLPSHKVEKFILSKLIENYNQSVFVVNNRGDPPLSRPIAKGIVNPKIW